MKKTVKHPKYIWVLSIQRLNKTLDNKNKLYTLLKIKMSYKKIRTQNVVKQFEFKNNVGNVEMADNL